MIYLVDDHPLMRDAIALVLRRLRPGMHIVELGRLSDVESTLRLDPSPRVIFLDLHLPDASGCSGVRRVKAMFPRVPLAVYSASPAVEMAHDCLDAGADMYIEKTVGSRELTAALLSLLPAIVGQPCQCASNLTASALERS